MVVRYLTMAGSGSLTRGVKEAIHARNGQSTFFGASSVDFVGPSLQCQVSKKFKAMIKSGRTQVTAVT